ncbi:MAG: SH3 domain-containing protein [Clostridia bacterium]
MKRRIFCILLIALTLMVSFAPMRHANALTLTTGKIVGSGIAFRKAADSDSKLIARLSEGTVVKILKANVNAEWYQVEYADKAGYVNRLYVDIEPSMPSYQMKYSGKVINCKENINVRGAASGKGAVLGVANKGAVLEVTQAFYNEGYHQILFNGNTGYVSKKYIELKAQVDNASLTDLAITGGTLYPKFSPNEYGYILTANAEQVTIKASANDGVKVSVDRTGVSSAKYTIRSGNSKTIRISVGGKVKYSIYLVRDVLTVGTWNIKRGNSNLVEQGWLIANERPDIIGIQEVYVNEKEQTNNLLSLRTREAQNCSFTPTIDYESGGQYGIGQISRFKPETTEKFELDSSGKEARALQKVVYQIDGKTVSVYNTHFSYESESIRRKQFSAIFQIMKKDKNPYKILTGDFNAKEAEFYEFRKGAYKVVNTSETKFYDYSYKRIDVNQIDNIIVSSNIYVLNGRAIPTEFSDHYPLFAFLSLR